MTAPVPVTAARTPPTPRTPGVRGPEIAVPAYVRADGPVLSELTATAPGASLVVLNPATATRRSTPPGRARDPDVPEPVVDNPGTATADCSLEPGHRTADVFVTYEGAYADHTSGGRPGGNVFARGAGYACATSAAMPNPRDTAPVWGFGPETGYAATLGQSRPPACARAVCPACGDRAYDQVLPTGEARTCQTISATDRRRPTGGQPVRTSRSACG